MVVVSCRVANRVKDPIRGILGDPELFFQFIQVKSRYEAVAESKWDTRSRQLVNAVEVDKLGFFATRGELAALIGWPNQAPFQPLSNKQDFSRRPRHCTSIDSSNVREIDLTDI
ncbi:hypothetical protein E4U47_004451 [Claviceps purpurea]|nr:hypothetical protein E4U38_003482 [Claviceps purpurea]KAG6178367.1 hypothetical protein E4U36_006467 [Claviceps purpurea]KAG6195739.1 hypothetical protein E4U10_001605 [Claviceps purpurea]KAG6267107.1 hypothetical protein E4U49_008380 [Claviceps purpurea]KAG6278957.1 hypothetical protein E4U47_004451 [Claviceps purpurea]